MRRTKEKSLPITLFAIREIRGTKEESLPITLFAFSLGNERTHMSFLSKLEFAIITIIRGEEMLIFCRHLRADDLTEKCPNIFGAVPNQFGNKNLRKSVGQVVS